MGSTNAQPKRLSIVQRLRVLFAGCPVEKALDAKTAACEEMSVQITDMSDATTLLIASYVPRRPVEYCEFEHPNRRATDRR